MNLRPRLIVAFFLLSVVPLGALTLYTFTGNVAAIRNAAEQEATALAGELSQGMETATAQLSQRMARLLDSSSTDAEPPPSTSAANAAARLTAPRAAADSTGPAASSTKTDALTPAESAAIGGHEMADALSDLSLLVNNIEIRGLGGRRGRQGQGGRAGFPRPGDQAGVPAPDPGTTPGFLRGRGGGPPDFSRRGTTPDGTSSLGGAPGGPPPPDDANEDPARIRIDLGPIRREILQTLVPDGRIDQLSPEERQRVFADVNQRMLDIQHGIQIVRETVAEQAASAEADATVTSPAGARTPTGPVRGVTPATLPASAADPAPPAPQEPSVTPASAVVPSAQAPAALATPTQRRSALTGSRLDVRVERNGEVVSQVTGDIDLPLLLNAVFSATRHDRGEVPFAVAKNGRLYTATNVDRETIEALDTVAIRPDTAPGTSVVPEWIVVTNADPTGSGLKFGIARPMGEALRELRSTTLRSAGIGLGFIGLALVAILPLSSRLTRNLSSLSDAVGRIAQGDYAARVAVRSHDEIGRLGLAFNQMAQDVELHQRSMVEQERIRRELELGRQIQREMLPRAPLKVGLTEIKGISVPAGEVGGDFFNYFEMHDGSVALLVGDVSGKGVGAALLMANIQASLRTRLSLGQDLASLATELDRDFESSTRGPVFATLFVGIFNPATRELRCVNAGHNPQFVLRQGGGLERLESTGLPIGLIAGRGYTEQRVQLSAGDLLFFYTDGCVEAENVAGEMFGPEQLEDLLASTAGVSADQLLARVEGAVSRFRAGREPSDDATLMVVKVG
jgi:serine phosphatase RsbU (regulator of sigma subunit)